MRHIAGIIGGFISGFLIYMMTTMVFTDLKDGNTPSALFVFIFFIGGWAVTHYYIIRGASGFTKPMARAFLIGSAEWMLMFVAGLIFSGRATMSAVENGADTATSAGAVIGGGLIATLSSFVSIGMAIFCAIGFFIFNQMNKEAPTVMASDTPPSPTQSLDTKKAHTTWQKVGFGIVCLFLFTIASNLMADKNRTPSTTSSSSSTINETPKVEPQKSPEEIKKILSGFKKKTDKMEGITWYSSHPQSESVTNKVETYMGQKNGHYWLRLKIMYKGDDWLFIKGIKFLIDGSSYEYNPSFIDVKRDSGSDGYDVKVWEWVDIPVKRDQYNILKMIAAGKEREMRYIGQQYYKDRKINESERKSIAKMIEAFEALGGTLN